MLIFLCITVAGFILLVGGSLFGHDHDGHVDHGHDAGHGVEAAVSVFSVKVIGTFILGFGAGGAIAAYYGANPLVASLIGLAVGFLMGLLMYGIMRLIYGQQANSIVTTGTAVGEIGTVTTAIGSEGTGEVDLTLRGQNRTFLARSADAKPISRGRRVEVVHTAGSQLVVREVPETAPANPPVSA